MHRGWGARFKFRKRPADVDAALRALLASSQHGVAFYRDLWRQEGTRPEAIRTVTDLPGLPITHRRDLTASDAESTLHASRRNGHLLSRHTTGTTGEPVTVYLNRTENLFRQLTLLDAFHRYIPFRLPLTLIDVGPESKDRAIRSEQWVGPVKIVRLFRGMPPDAQIERLQHVGPAILEGRPTPLWELACALRDRGIRPPRPRLVISYAEMLYPHVRRLLEETFGAPVTDLYNCEEVGNVAWQCPDDPGTMHPNPSTCWLEVVDPKDRPLPYGQTGRILVTNLYNHTMPFIRYETGDLGTLLEPARCSCGFRGPRMRLAEGRDEDFFVLPDGREITPRLAYDAINAALPHHDPTWRHVDAMRAFQIIQEAEDLVTVKVVPGPAHSPDLWPSVQDSLRSLHPSMRLHVELVEDLAVEPGAKFHQVVSLLESRWGRERAAG